MSAAVDACSRSTSAPATPTSPTPTAHAARRRRAGAGAAARTGAAPALDRSFSSMTILQAGACFRRTTGGTRRSAARRSIRSPTRSSTSSAARGRLHPDFGPPPYGIPVRRRRRRRAARAGHVRRLRRRKRSRASARSAAIPIPEAAKTQPNFIEGGRAGGGTDGDRHLLIVDRDRWLLFELFATRWTGQRWEAGSGAVFDLSANARRPEGWTSADAAGLAILPGLVRYDEAMRGPIRHALRVDGAAHQWLRVAGLAPRRQHRRRAADGRAAAAEIVEGYFAVSRPTSRTSSAPCRRTA